MKRTVLYLLIFFIIRPPSVLWCANDSVRLKIARGFVDIAEKRANFVIASRDLSGTRHCVIPDIVGYYYPKHRTSYEAAEYSKPLFPTKEDFDLALRLECSLATVEEFLGYPIFTDPKAKDAITRTACLRYSYDHTYESCRIIRKLIDHGADVFCKNESEETPLDYLFITDDYRSIADYVEKQKASLAVQQNRSLIMAYAWDIMSWLDPRQLFRSA